MHLKKDNANITPIESVRNYEKLSANVNAMNNAVQNYSKENISIFYDKENFIVHHKDFKSQEALR